MADGVRSDHALIAGFVPRNSAVLDLGCGDGELLALLKERRGVRGQGIEIDEQSVYACMARGVSVLQGDIDTGLPEYADDAFDFVIMNDCLQQVREPGRALAEALRVGRHVVIGFPNFAHFTARLQMFFGGRAPKTPSLPFEWHDTPNSHFLSIRDFDDYCARNGYCVRERIALAGGGRVRLFPNVFGQTGIYLLERCLGGT